MSRLPVPGQDVGAWGTVLNDFLNVAHTTDGNLQNGYITNAHIASGAAIAQSKIQNLVSALAGKVDEDSLVVNVRHHGATGDGSTDDTAAIQGAIDSSAAGATIFFPAGTYAISNALILLPDRAYVGGGTAFAGSNGGALIKQKDGANITGTVGVTGLLVAQAWATNAATCDDPIAIANLALDGNASNNSGSTACGIVLVNFNSSITSCLISNVSTHGILLTDTTDDGTVVSNSCSENWVVLNKIENPDADGIHQISANSISNQDGYCVHNFISQTTGCGMQFARAAGWEFTRNHLYTIQQHGMHLSNCYGTVVQTNYIEDFGNEATAGEYYDGIYVSQLDGAATIVANNFIGCTEPSATVGGYEYIGATSGSGQANAHLIVSSNALIGPDSPTSVGLGVAAANSSGGVLHCRFVGNRIDKINTPAFIDSGVLVLEQSEQLIEHAINGATTSRYGDTARGSGAPAVGGSGNDLYGVFSFGTGTGATTGTVGGISFETNFAAPPVIILTPANAATAALGVYVASTNAGFFDIGVATAPSDGQAADTYVINYSVQG